MAFFHTLQSKIGGRRETMGEASYDSEPATSHIPYCDRDLADGLQKTRILRILIGAVLFTLALLLLKMPVWGKWLFLIAAAVCAGVDIYLRAVRQALSRHFAADFLYGVSSVLLFVCGRGAEGASVILLVSTGAVLLDLTKRHSRRMISEKADLRPVFVNLCQDDGSTIEISPNEVAEGQRILVQKDEYVPLDCCALDDGLLLDASILTGCDEGRNANAGDQIPAGVFNLGKAFTASVIRQAEDSAAWKVMAAVESAASAPGRFEKRFRRIWSYVTLGVLGATLITLIACLATKLGVQESVVRAASLLVLGNACAPLALISVVYFSGIAGTARQGVLVRTASAMDVLSQTQAVVFDKVGTVTMNHYRVVSVSSTRMEDELFLQIAALIEDGSSHPIAQAIRNAAGKLPPTLPIDDYRVHPGLGVSAQVNGVTVTLGSFSWMKQMEVKGLEQAGSQKAVYMAFQGIYAGCVVLEETVNAEAAAAIYALGEAGCERIALLSCDSRNNCSELAKTIGITEYYAECQSKDKQSHLQDIRTRLGNRGSLLYVVGSHHRNREDAADLHLSMDGLEHITDTTADIIALDDKLTKVPFVIQAALSIRRQTKIGCACVCGAKLVLALLAVLGILPVWLIVTADFAVGIAAVWRGTCAYRLPGQPDWKALLRGEL